MNPIHIPQDWDVHALLTFEEFYPLIHTPQRTLRDSRGRRRAALGPIRGLRPALHPGG